MSAVPFDTLKLATALGEQAHFTPEQAKGITRAFGEAFEERIATRDDISDFKRSIDADISGLKHDIANVRQEIVSLRQGTFNETGNVRKEMVILEQRLTIKMGSMFVVAIGVITGLVKLIHG